MTIFNPETVTCAGPAKHGVSFGRATCFSKVMPEVTFDFQEGFEDDTAEVWVGQVQLLKAEHLNTSKLIGLADSTSIDLPEGIVELELRLPGRNIKHSIALDTRKIRHVGVSLLPKGLTVTLSERPFGYM